MLTAILIFALISKTAVAQVNGEFWWLSDKVTKLNGAEIPPAPKFEQLSEFDTDKSAKITFRDDNLISSEDKYADNNAFDKNQEMKKLNNNYFFESSIVWPDDTLKEQDQNTKKNHNNQFLSYTTQERTTKKPKINTKQNSGDVFIFRFPEDDNVVMKYPQKAQMIDDSSQVNATWKQMLKDEDMNVDEVKAASREDNKMHNSDSLIFKYPDDDFDFKRTTLPEKVEKSQNNENSMFFIDNEITNPLTDSEELPNSKGKSFSENICTFVKKSECLQRSGVIYPSEEASIIFLNNTNLICCVLPLPKVDPDRIIFPDALEIKTKRFRRSNQESDNRSQRQRDFILRQRFRPQNKNTKPTTKIVTPSDDDYIDPYLNIKGSSFKPNAHSSSKQDYNYPDFVEDYIVELPKPGLVGLYSDNGDIPPWSFMNENDRPAYGASVDESEEEEEEQSFGYSTVDPRKGTSKPKRGRPLKLTTAPPEEVAIDVESQTVSFQSSPNFQVLQGFKLLNLGRTKNKFYSKNNRRSTTEGVDYDIKDPEEVSSHLTFNSNGESQVYANCGRARKVDQNERNDKQTGEARNGSHPWMALVVLTRRPQGILCYATIVHPRAAVTAGDCVYGRTSPKEVHLLAGLWNLNDRTRIQNRVVTVQLHPQYRPKVLAHDLALLHWNVPLKLNANIQPACLGSVSNAGDCKFFGWGGFDQGIRPKSRWQHASIITKQECLTKFSKAVKMPEDSFCAMVQTRGTVTGIGGSLMCDVNGRKTTAGVAVWRDNALVLIPAQEWLLRAFQDLNIE